MRSIIVILTLFCYGLMADPCSAPWLGGAHSGAPGEVSCTGCHYGNANTGPGLVDFQIGSGNGNYSPGEIINFFLQIEEEGINQFGFQTVALRSSNNANAGEFIISDPDNTRLIEDDHHGSDRIYIGHTICGADANPSGSKNWSFNWQAPESNLGDIQFYLSTLAANHNHGLSFQLVQ